MKTYLFFAAFAASLFVADSASAQGSCRERERCTTDNAIIEVQREAAHGAQRAAENPDSKGRVSEAIETLGCILKCISEVLEDVPQQIQGNSSEAEPEETSEEAPEEASEEPDPGE